MRRIPVWRGAGTGSSPAWCHILVSNSALITLILVSKLCCHLFAISMAGCSQNILISIQDGGEMLGIFRQGPDAMIFLLIGSLLCEDDAIQHKKKIRGKHLCWWAKSKFIMGSVCSAEPHSCHKKSASPRLLTEMWEGRNYLCLAVEGTTCLTDKTTLLVAVYAHIQKGADTLVSGGQETLPVLGLICLSLCSQHVSPGSALLHPPQQP